MGRFKIYDPAKLVNILNDSKYAKCLLCEKKLKNIMGNIKRHYEQMHCVYVNANANKTQKYRKKSTKFGEKDKDYKVHKKTKTSVDKNNQNDIKIHSTDIVKTMESATGIPLIVSSKFNNNLVSAPMLPEPDSTEYDQLKKDSKPNSSSNKYQMGNDKNTPTAQNNNQVHPLNSFTVSQGTKLKEQTEKPKKASRTDIKQALSAHSSNIEHVKCNGENEEIQIPCYSYINNIQISSLNSCHQLDFLKCLVETKSHVNIPLTFFQKADTFQKALQMYKPNFQFNHSSETIGEHIDRMAKKLRQEITKLVSNKIIHLKLDIASSTEGNIMFVNVQFINDFEIKVITLSALELSDDDLTTYLKKKVLTVLERYKIDIGRVYSIIKDNTNNVRNNVKESNHDLNIFQQPIDYCQHLCHNFPGHAIHFVANGIIKQLNENISQSRDSVKSLRRQFSQLNIKNLPLLDNATSWFSVYDMIESLLGIRDIVESNTLLVVEVDWLFATKFVESFRPIVDAALMLQSNNLFVMGDFYREWLLCEVELEELAVTNEIALYLREAFRTQKMDFFKNTSFLAALYLDPRFCYMGSMYLSDKQKELAITQLLQIFSKVKVMNENITCDNVNHNDRYSKLEKYTAASLKTDVEIITFDAVSCSNVDYHWLRESLEQLQFEERLPFKTNILEYWNTVKYKSPVLAKIAEIALAAPATQATINRALNVTSINLLRRKLIENGDNTENLLLLKLNQDLVSKITFEN